MLSTNSTVSSDSSDDFSPTTDHALSTRAPSGSVGPPLQSFSELPSATLSPAFADYYIPSETEDLAASSQLLSGNSMPFYSIPFSQDTLSTPLVSPSGSSSSDSATISRTRFSQPSVLSQRSVDTLHISDTLPPLAFIFPSVPDRWTLYDSFIPSWEPTLLDLSVLIAMLDTCPPQPGSFFPGHPEVAAHSLHSAHALFYVHESQFVPGEAGLFSNAGLDPHPTDHLLGCYFGWVHAFEDGDSGYPPFTSPIFDMYSLDIGQGLIATAFDSSLDLSQRSYLFPYSFANEYIWHPDGNLLHFGDRGTVILRAHSGIPVDQEIFMSFGPQHDWSPVRHSLMLRLLSTLSALATAIGRPSWAASLSPYTSLLHSTSLPDVLASSSPSVRPLHLILAVVDWYSPHSLSGHIHPLEHDTLTSWIVRCAKVRLISIHHVFRKANHPQRPPYHLDSLLAQLLAIPAPPDRSSSGRTLRPLSSLRVRSFLPDPQDPEDDLLSEHFYSASVPPLFFESIDFSPSPSLETPWLPTSALATPSTPTVDSTSSVLDSPPTVLQLCAPLSPYASLPFSLSPSRPFRPSPRPGGLLVALAMSHERPSDCIRIVQLLRHFAVVIGVSVIPPPIDPREFRSLLPYHISGRYIHICQDFSVLHLRDSLSPVLQAHLYLSPRVAVLDYYHLATGYYLSRYGSSWFSHTRVGLPSQPGLSQILLRSVTDIFLPRDKGGTMDSLHRDYHPLPQLGPALSIHPTHWNPLTRSDFQLSFDDPSLSPSYQLSQYLSQPPFLRVSIAPPPGNYSTYRCAEAD